jgi:hypothetical protein
LESKYGAVSLAGIGDRTENIIYRLSQGFLRNFTSNPLIVVLAGGSNVAIGDCEKSVYNGIQAILQLIRKDLPNANVVLISMIPSPRAKNNTYALVNDKLRAEYASGKTKDSHITYIDVSSAFLTVDGKINKALYTADNIHPNSCGYEIIMKALQPHINKLPVVNLPPRSKPALPSKRHTNRLNSTEYALVKSSLRGNRSSIIKSNYTLIKSTWKPTRNISAPLSVRSSFRTYNISSTTVRKNKVEK